MIKINQAAVDQKERQARIATIDQRLAEIDQCSVRPLRSKVAGMDTQEDLDKLEALEAEAAYLRAERSALIDG